MRSPYLGVWLDHREAYLLWVSEDGQAELQHARADYPEKAERVERAMSGRQGVYGGLAPHAELHEKQRRAAVQFYEKIFRAIRKAENVYIFGPGQARKELHKRLREHKDFNGHIRAVESAEKMSEPQMAARVRSFFDLPHPAG
ncbi:MAG: hypothetical protein ACYS8K_03110 [Planctomycetota bacterium]|jgi:stalled ribosome rescue protein Dom34